jgi:hypothetical protein
VAPLQELLVQTDYLTLSSLSVSKLDIVGDEEGNTDRSVQETLHKAADMLKACAKALASNSLDDLQEIEEWNEESLLEPAANFRRGASVYIYRQASNVRVATIAWLSARHHPEPSFSKVGMKTALKPFLALFVSAFFILHRLAFALTLPFKPGRWSLPDVLWASKLSLGFVILLIMTVYWDGYANFAIEESRFQIGAVYYGWNMLGYAFAWRPTVEGTVKKGIQRALGTALGGFMAWLGIIVASWSYDDDAEINPYGLVAWLTVTSTLIGGYLSVDKGIAARMGGGYDHGYTGTYFIMTEALIALEVYAGQGSKNGLTANRLVATLTGVFMAMIMSSLPPTVRGGDPKYTRRYLTALNDAFNLILLAFSDEKEYLNINSDEFKKELVFEASEKRRHAVFLLKDAAKLKALPFYRVSEKIGPLLEKMAVTESNIGRLQDAVAHAIEHNFDLGPARQGIKDIMDGIDHDGKQDENMLGAADDVAMVQTQMFLSLVLQTRVHLKDHETSLDEIK